MYDEYLFFKFLFSHKSSGLDAIVQHEFMEAASHLITQEIKTMQARIATSDDMPKIYKLAYQVYLREGYCKENSEQELRHYPHLDNIDETTVIVIDKDGNIVGTNTITIDGPHGLYTDIDFPEETKQIRNLNYENLACIWRLVTLETHSLNIITLLLNFTIELMIEKNIKAVLIIVNPRHQSFYESILKFDIIKTGHCNSVNKPGVLMIGYLDKITKQWIKISKKFKIPFKYADYI